MCEVVVNVQHKYSAFHSEVAFKHSNFLSIQSESTWPIGTHCKICIGKSFSFIWNGLKWLNFLENWINTAN